MTVGTLDEIGAVAACAAAAAALLVRDPRLRSLALAIAVVLASALIAEQIWDQNRFADVRESPLLLAGLALATAAVLAAGGALFARYPAVFVALAFATLPLRVPVPIGPKTNFLLIPLYGVIAAGLVRSLWLAWRRPADAGGPGSPTRDEPVAVRWLCIALAASIVVYAVATAWSNDSVNALRNVCFFLVPFAALFALLRDLPWDRRLIATALGASAAMAALFAAIAGFQYVTRDLTFNIDLVEANQLHLYFRVNSLFRDPNIFGRYLALVIVALGALIAWTPSRRLAIGGFALAVLLLPALIVTFSISSFVALAAGLGAVAWLRLGVRGILACVAIGFAAIALYFAAIGSPADTGPGTATDLTEFSSGRADLVTGGAELFEERPLTGWGSGSFAKSFRQEIAKIVRPVSHNEAITVAAEEGVLGLVPYIAILVFGTLTLVRPWPSRDAARAGVAACAAALAIHSMAYAGFAIDPATWALLALGVALRPRPGPASEIEEPGEENPPPA